METGTCSRRKALRKGSCKSWPLLLAIFSVFKNVVVNQRLTTARSTPPPQDAWPFRNPAFDLRFLFISERVVRCLHLYPERCTHQVEFFAEAALQKALVGIFGRNMPARFGL